MDLSIVIVNWNVKDLLQKALQAIKDHPARKYNYEVIVVDNNSSDDSCQMVKNNFPETILIEHPENAGFAKGNNIGIAKTSGEIILCLNPDTEVHEGALDFYVDQMRADKKLGAMGVKLLNSDGTLQPSCKSFPGFDTIIWNATSLDTIFPKSKLFGKYNMTWFNHDQEIEVDQPMGAALAVKKEVIDQIGVYDERYFMYFDEVDWCYRIKKAGWKIKFFPQVSITHHWAQSTSQALFKMNYQWYKSFYKYLVKNSFWPRPIILFVLTSMIWLKLLVLSLLVALLIKTTIMLWSLTT